MPLYRQPEFFQMNDDQTLMIISSAEDGVYVDMTNRQEIDLDDKFNIGCIKEIIHDQEDKVFYILANKYDEKLGFFLIKMHESKVDEFKFLTKYKNKLDIGDVNLYVLEEKGVNDRARSELIITYKTIYINIYTINVISLDSGLLIFRHESACLWESAVSGFLNTSTLDFISLDS